MSGQALARKTILYKTISLAAGILEMVFGIVSFAMGLAAGFGYREILIQVTSTIILLSGLFEFLLQQEEATTAPDYGGSAFAGSVSTIAGSVCVVMEISFLYIEGITLAGLHVGILLCMLCGTAASIVHMAYRIAPIRAAYALTHGRARTIRSGRGTVELYRHYTGWRWSVYWLCCCEVLNDTRTRIQIISLEDGSRNGVKFRADDATTSCDLQTHVNVCYDPEPPCYDDITKTPQLLPPKTDFATGRCIESSSML